MALSVRLQGRQVQSLVITPQLMQAIRLLQMSGLELERFVAAELEQNPLLELDESAAAPVASAEDPQPASEGPAPELAISEADGVSEAAIQAVDADTADVFPEQVGSDSGWTPSLPGTRSSSRGSTATRLWPAARRSPRPVSPPPRPTPTAARSCGIGAAARPAS